MADAPLTAEHTRIAMFCHGCLKWGTPFADREDHECGNCGSRETDRYVEEPALIDAEAREAALAGALASMIREHESSVEELDSASVCGAREALASPSRGAEGYRLAKALADALLRQKGGQVCAAVAGALAAYREHEED